MNVQPTTQSRMLKKKACAWIYITFYGVELHRRSIEEEVAGRIGVEGRNRQRVCW